jgi:hydroxymethylpyrimidine pyrophosphatase-like HAD family hydrolase
VVPQYKLVAVDIDGTLLTSKGTISPRTRQALQGLSAHGVHLAIATGRRRRTAQPIVAQLEAPHFLIASQGATVYEDGAILFHSHLPAPAARAALDIIRRHCLPAAILGNALREEIIWVDGDWRANERLAGYLQRNIQFVRELTPDALEHDPIELIVMDTVDRLRRLDEALTGHRAPPPAEDAPAEQGPDERRPLWRVIFSRFQLAAGAAIEIVGPTTSKANALAFLCGRLGITPQEVLAFGDNVNDLEMLAFAGLGVAMGNATEDARAVADRIAPSNDEDGIAVVLQELGLA